jgi:hypothetical protein
MLIGGMDEDGNFSLGPTDLLGSPAPERASVSAEDETVDGEGISAVCQRSQ